MANDKKDKSNKNSDDKLNSKKKNIDNDEHVIKSKKIKHKEKEAQKAARAELREAARLQKEIEAQRKKIEKEQTHYQTAYDHILKQLEQSPEDSALLAKKSELEN